MGYSGWQGTLSKVLCNHLQLSQIQRSLGPNRLSKSTKDAQLVVERFREDELRAAREFWTASRCFSLLHAVQADSNLGTEEPWEVPQWILEVRGNWPNNSVHSWPPLSFHVPFLMVLSLLGLHVHFLWISDLEFVVGSWKWHILHTIAFPSCVWILNTNKGWVSQGPTIRGQTQVL